MTEQEFVDIVRTTQDSWRRRATQAVSSALVVRNWLLGRHIVEFEQAGDNRAKYGAKLLPRLATKLKAAGVPGSSLSNLKSWRQFYEAYPAIGQTLSGQSATDEESQSIQPLGLSPRLLSWSHYVVLLSLRDTAERGFYEREALAGAWTVRQLERQVSSALYERLALGRDAGALRALADDGHRVEAPRDLVKDPYVLEFLGLEPRASFSESELESAIIDRLEQFLLELGKGFLFEGRQKRFSFGEQHFYVDLVFYNRLLRCYVLIDLKLDLLTHQDLGQMQMYVNYFDRHVKTADEHPTVGIVLCKRKHDALVELTLPADANIFASQYLLYLPSKDEFRRQLEEAAESVANAHHEGNE